MQAKQMKDTAIDVTKKAISMVRDEDSPLNRARSAANNADKTLRTFAKNQPIAAVLVAVAAGYLFGRAVAKAT
jgi:ElaB/YqjD/DUF883 family membrane-anchored ribosome-binding protein